MVTYSNSIRMHSHIDKEMMEIYEGTDQPILAHSLLQDEMLPVKYYRLSVTKIRLVSEYLGLAVPLLVTVCYTWLKHQRHLLDLFKKHASLALLSYEGMLHVVRIEALLRFVRIRLSEQIDERQLSINNKECVECEVLYDPGPEMRSADVIFIHGIKGALTKTWRQGRWQMDAVKLERLDSTSLSQSDSMKSVVGTVDYEQTSHEDWREMFSGLREQDDTLKQNDIRTSLENEEPFINLKHSKENLCKYERVSCENEKKKVTDERSSCWPKDWLPLDCPTARVIAVNYTTDPNLWSPFWSTVPPRSTMPERAWEMISKLISIEVGQHPIIWVGHSKGGLYIKQMLVNSSESTEVRYRQVCESTRGILFYSVPHRGSKLAKFNILPIILRRSVELTEVQDNCKEILSLDRKFKELLEKQGIDFLIKSFVETSLTLMFIIYVRVVPLESAINDFGEIFGVELDHRNICKPRNRGCFLYRELIDIIERCQNYNIAI